MKLLKRLGFGNVLILALCVVIILVAEYVFLHGDQLHAIFIGLWAPTLLGIAIFFKQITNGR
ncbi:MAG: hypothetical protein GYB32_13155 [Algicola sp.]|nr:hypothetical protein [Algicola sp.]